MEISNDNVKDLIDVFARLFAEDERTQLVHAEGDPYYKPVGPEGELAEIAFAHGFFSSALHEISHWCIAGRERRKLPDFGYWYKPEGRSADEQASFEQVEVKPQALEWVLSMAAGSTFNFSADNLQAGGAEMSPAWRKFQENVARQARAYVGGAMPPRAKRFAQALSEHFGTGRTWADPGAYQV